MFKKWASPLSLAVAGTLLALGIRWAVIYRYGVDLPLADQWDGELERLYFKYLDGSLNFGDFFLPANEHRIVFTRLLNLALFWLNDEQFNNRSICAAQAVVSVLPLLPLLWAMNREQRRPWTTLLLGGLFGVCFSPENLLWGYQSQVYFALTAAAAGLYFAARPTVPFWPVALCVGLGIASMASAMFTATAAAGAALLRYLQQRHSAAPPDRRLLLKALAFLVLAYAASRCIWHNPGHVVLRAHSWHEFFGTWVGYLAFPTEPFVHSGFVLWGGLLAIGVQQWRAGVPLSPSQGYALLWLAWFLMATVAAAYARSNALPVRYHDYIVMGYVAGAVFALPRLAALRSSPACRAWVFSSAIILAVLGNQEVRRSRAYWQERTPWRAMTSRALRAGEQGPAAVLEVLAEHPMALYPRDDVLAHILAQPQARRALRQVMAPPARPTPH